MEPNLSKIPTEYWARLPWHKRKWILLRVLCVAFFSRLERRRSPQRYHYINDRRNRPLRPIDLLFSVMVSEIMILLGAGLAQQPIYLFAIANILLVALAMLPTIFGKKYIAS